MNRFVHRPWFGALFLTSTLIFPAPSQPARADESPAASQPSSKPAEAKDFPALSIEMLRAYGSGDYAAALKAAEQMHELRPGHVNTMYNIACFKCLTGDKEGAYQWLEKAAESGYRNVEKLTSEDDFKTIRGEDRFRAIVRRLRSKVYGGGGDRFSDRMEKMFTDAEMKFRELESKSGSERRKMREAGELFAQIRKAHAEGDKKELKNLLEKFDQWIDDHADDEVGEIDEDEDDDEQEDQPSKSTSDQEKFAKVNQLAVQVVAAIRVKDYDQALELALKAREIADVGLANYNVACAYSLKNQKDKAFEYLFKAAEQGLHEIHQDIHKAMMEDHDLNNIRNDRRFPRALRIAYRTAIDQGYDEVPGEDEPDDEEDSDDSKEDAGRVEDSRDATVVESQDESGPIDIPQTDLSVSVLTQRMLTARDRGAYKEAAGYALAALRKEENGATHYNVACMYSLLGRKNKAFEHLDRTLELGVTFTDDLAAYMEQDSDFDKIRNDPRFPQALDKARAGKSDESDEPESDGERELSQAEKVAQVNKLAHEVIALSREKKYDEALKVALKAREIADIGLANYNVACMYALKGETEKAFEYLAPAAEQGLGDIGQDIVKSLESDTDLDSLRGDDRFNKLLRKARRIHGAEAGESDQRKDREDPDRDSGRGRGRGEGQGRGEGEGQGQGDRRVHRGERPGRRNRNMDNPAPAPAPAPQAGENPYAGLTDEEREAKLGELIGKLFEAINANENEKALEWSLEARKVVDNGLTNYNVACMYARLKKNDEAFQALDRTLELGGIETENGMDEQIRNDGDFDNIRDDDRYQDVLRRAAKLKREKPRTRMPEGEPVAAEHRVTLPEGYDAAQAVPLIVALHHYTGSMDAATEHWKAAAGRLGAILLTPQGTFKLDDGKFEWGGDLQAVEKNVLDAIETVKKEYKIDKDRIVLVGFSQGGWAAWHIGLRHPEVFHGIVPVGGDCGNAVERMASGGGKPRVYVMIGEQENNRVLRSNRRAVRAMRDAGLNAKIKVYDGLGHAFPPDATEEQTKALKFVLGQRESADID